MADTTVHTFTFDDGTTTRPCHVVSSHGDVNNSSNLIVFLDGSNDYELTIGGVKVSSMVSSPGQSVLWVGSITNGAGATQWQ